MEDRHGRVVGSGGVSLHGTAGASRRESMCDGSGAAAVGHLGAIVESRRLRHASDGMGACMRATPGWSARRVEVHEVGRGGVTASQEHSMEQAERTREELGGTKRHENGEEHPSATRMLRWGRVVAGSNPVSPTSEDRTWSGLSSFQSVPLTGAMEQSWNRIEPGTAGQTMLSLRGSTRRPSVRVGGVRRHRAVCVNRAAPVARARSAADEPPALGSGGDPRHVVRAGRVGSWA